jgi:hypothetical protein
MMAVYHNHHIVPKHAGGSDDETNLIKVSLTQHTMWHFANWQLWRRKEDFLAYKGLGGQVPGEEMTLERRKIGQINGGKAKTPKKQSAARSNAVKARKALVEKKVGLGYATTEQQREFGKKGGAKGKGYIWINNGEKTTQIPGTSEVPQGWKRGRKL